MAETPLNMCEFARKSEAYYNKIKEELESKYRGDYAALSFETEQYWIGKSASEALVSAKQAFPKKLFYLVQVGSPSAFSIQSMLPGDDVGGAYDYKWSY